MTYLFFKKRSAKNVYPVICIHFIIILIEILEISKQLFKYIYINYISFKKNREKISS